MMEAPQFVSPTNSMKRKNQIAARRIKNGSPKLQEVFRQRCRQRMHEKRNELFFKRRLGIIDFSQDEKETLAEIVHSEFENLASMDWNDPAMSLSSPQNSPKKIFSENQHEFNTSIADESFEIEEDIEEQWLLNEYQKILWEQKQMSSLFENDEVVCPICLKNFLFEIPNYAVCHCGLKLSIQFGLNYFKQNIREQVKIHSEACLSAPVFSVFQDGESGSLCLTCTSCDIFALV